MTHALIILRMAEIPGYSNQIMAKYQGKSSHTLAKSQGILKIISGQDHTPRSTQNL